MLDSQKQADSASGGAVRGLEEVSKQIETLNSRTWTAVVKMEEGAEGLNEDQRKNPV